MKLKILSDGTNSGTAILDEFGNRIENVVSVDWSMKVGELSRATIEIRNIELETGVEHQKNVQRLTGRMIRLCMDKVVEESESILMEPKL